MSLWRRIPRQSLEQMAALLDTAAQQYNGAFQPECSRAVRP